MRKYISRVFKKSISFWSNDKSLSLLLISLVLTFFVIYPIAQDHIFWLRSLAVFIGINFITGVFLLTRNKFKRLTGLVFAIVTIVISLIENGISVKWRIAELSLWIIYFIILALLILKRVFFDEEVNLYRIQGAVAAYIIFGIVFAFIYLLIFTLDSQAFLINERILQSSAHRDYNFVYFSFVTLCTLGYGDISPLSHIAQSVSLLEALTGILFPGILIARLVGLTGGKKLK
jgi:hypothetical protein